MENMRRIELRNRNIYLLFIGVLFISACEAENNEHQVFELLPPILTEVSAKSQTAFQLNWKAVDGADGYQVDVSLNDDFSSFVEDYNDREVNRSQVNVINLDPNTQYFVRARTIIGSELSGFSNVISAKTDPEPVPEPTTPLKEVAEFPVGMIVQSTKLSGKYHEIYTAEFDQITAEWEMKMDVMYPSSSGFDFTRSDAIVNYATSNGIAIHGHSLIWHNATPDWVKNYQGTNEEFEAMVKDYIITTVTRYKGKIRSWDVVNEAFEDGSGALRNSVFRQKMGDNFIEKCYKWTKEADPDVLIFYNDYNMTFDTNKLNASLEMADDFLKRGVPIDGIGFQMHISYNGPSRSTIESAARKVTDRGLLLHFSELDIRANPDNDLTSLTIDRAIAQQAKYKEVVEIYRGIPEESKFALTVWGMRDNESWLLNFWGHIDWPLMYNEDFTVKKAHTGFLEGLE